MSTSRVPDVIDALVALFDAAAALADVQVLDGPPITGDPLHEVVFVGYTGDEDETESATFSQSWVGLGANAKDEQIVVTCAVAVWRGQNDASARSAARTRVFELLGAVEDVLRDDPSIGLSPPTVAELASGSLHQDQHSSGFEARIPFQVGIKTRI